MLDAVIVGGGIVGAAIAFELGRRGAKVEIVDPGLASPLANVANDRPRASQAAAGIVGAQLEARHGDSPLARFCLEGLHRFEPFVHAVEASSNLDVEYRSAGVLATAFDAHELDAWMKSAAWQRELGFDVQRLDDAAARAIEPALSAEIAGAIRFPHDGRVDPRAFLEATMRAAAANGVRIRGGEARRIVEKESRAIGVEGEGFTVLAKHVVLCAGAWSARVEGVGLGARDVEPARGQMLELRTEPGLIRAVVESPSAYLSPRDDGRVLVGSTVELVGFHPEVTVNAVRDLLAGAVGLAPKLANATLSDSWAGLRPRASDELPILGNGSREGLIVATGHFRNGILLAPITAEIVANLIEGKPSTVDLAPFSPSRFV